MKVTFTLPVDKTSAETIANYYVGGTVLASPSTATLQSDNKTVVVTLATGLSNGVQTYEVKPIQSKDSASVLTDDFATSQTVSDTTAPSITSVTSSTSGLNASTVVVKFSEPLGATPTFTVDGTAVAGGSVALDTTDKNNETYNLTGLTLDASKSHTLAVTGVKDCVPSTNANVANILTKTFSVTADSTAPIATISAKSDHEIALTFNKAMTASTVTGAAIVVNDESQTLVSGTSVSADPNDTTNTKFIVSVPVSTLYASASTRNLTVVLPNTITDSVGNALASTSLPVTLKEDTTAPVITSLAYDTDTTTGTNYGYVKDIILNVNKGVKAGVAGTITTSGIKVVDNNGKDVSTGFFGTSSATKDGDTKVVLPLFAEAKLSGVYTFYLPANLITDNTNDANQSAAVALTVDFGSTTGTFSIKQANVSVMGSVQADGTESFTVNYGVAVKGGTSSDSATNASNYTLNGAALPANTLITLNSPGQTTATIQLPKSAVTADNSAAVLTITGSVKDLNGETLVPFTGYVDTKDNTAPVLQTAQIVSSTDIILTFSENMTSLTSQSLTAGTDLTIKVAGSAVTPTISATSVAGHANQVELQLGTALDLTKAITVTTGTSTYLKDASVATNAMTAKTTVTATK